MKNALLVSSFLGILWLALLFVLSFFCVHLYKLAKLGQKYRKEKQAENKKMQNPTSTSPAPAPIKKDEEKLSPKKQEEPIYYIVERKRKKKPQFSEPKRIQFK